MALNSFTVQAHNNQTYLRRRSAAVLCFFPLSFVATDNPPQPSTSFSAQLEARTNYKLRVISYNWAANVTEKCGKMAPPAGPIAAIRMRTF